MTNPTNSKNTSGEMMPDDPNIANEMPKPQGCGLIASLFILAAWVVGITILSLASSWLIEQGLFEGSLPVPDVRWPIALGYALGVGIPCGFVVWLIKSPRSRLIYRTWLMAALFSLALVPAKMVKLTDAPTVSVLQILGMSAYLYCLFLWIRNKYPGDILSRTTAIFKGGWSAWLAGPFLLLPWVLYGALGTPVDVLLNILTALLFGVCASLTVYAGILRSTASLDREYRTSDLLIDSLGVFFALAIMVTGLGQTGTQLTLMASVPLLALAVVALSMFGHTHQNKVVNWAAGATLLGLAALGPLTWIDPDEMMLVISSSQGELLEWVLKAGSQTLLAILAIDSIAFIFWRRTLDARGYFWAGKAVVVALWIGLAVVYGVFGLPGFFGEKLFVIMADQADVGVSASIQNIDQRRADVYSRLVSHADATQADLRTALEKRNISYTPYYLVNAIEVNGGPLLKLWLTNRSDVDRVLDSPHLRPLPDPLPVSEGSAGPSAGLNWNLSMIKADQVWNDLKVTGKGIVIGQSDSGVQGDHSELADSYLGRDGDNDFHWFDPWYGSQAPSDIGGHGTHTMGIIAGNEVGVAPDADWIGCVNLARNLGNPAYYLDCWQFMLAPFPQNGDALRDGNPSQAADILNNSWGCPEVEGCDPGIYEPAVKALRAAGIFVVVSAGNSGSAGCGSVDSPAAIYPEVYSVGAVDQAGQLADFSSLGPVIVDGSLRVKPDIVAPGVDILSSYPGNTYEYASGTSMAGPHTVGVVALMWSANPKLIGNIDLTTKILNETALPYTGQYPNCVIAGDIPNNAVGYGLIDAYEAVKQALLVQ